MPTAAVPSGEIAHTTARILLEIGAVLFRPNDPFIFTSGRASPVYIDCRKIISFPRARAQLMDFACALIQREAGYESIDRSEEHPSELQSLMRNSYAVLCFNKKKI